jgi:hypothetical protein
MRQVPTTGLLSVLPAHDAALLPCDPDVCSLLVLWLWLISGEGITTVVLSAGGSDLRTVCSRGASSPGGDCDPDGDRSGM